MKEIGKLGDGGHAIFKGTKIKTTAKFRALRRLRFEDTQG